MPAAAASKGKVLVVDDDRDIRAVIRASLSHAGYEVLEAEDGVTGYERLKRLNGGVQLVITQVDLPRVDGVTLGRKIAAEYPHVKVLYIFGSVPPESSMEIPSGVILTKPFGPDDLVRCVRRILHA